MKKNIFHFYLWLLFLIFPGIVGAVQKTVTINWAIDNVTDVVGYKVYYSTSNNMDGKILACETGDVNVTTLTCDNVVIVSYPLYFTIASVTLAEEFESEIFEIDLTPSLVQDFVVVSEGGEPPPTSISISNLTPGEYQVAELLSGDQYYIDRTYVINDMPESLEGLMGIKTGNNDKLNNDEVFLTFDVDQAGKLYIAYDARSATYPLWLTSAFSDTGLSISTNDCQLSVWQRDIGAGQVTIPGNVYGGVPPGMGSNYFVLVGPQ